MSKLRSLKGGPACQHDLMRARMTSNFLFHESSHPAFGQTPRHDHALPTVTILLFGAYRETYRKSQPDIECSGQGVLLRPAGKGHVNHYGPDGAHNLVIELPAVTAEALTAQGLNMSDVHVWRHPELIRLGRTITEALPHRATHSVIEGLAFELLADLLRLTDAPLPRRRSPVWLRRAQELIHARFDDPALRVATIASVVGVHPVHLARVFIAVHGCGPQAYLLRIRLDEAARLLGTDVPLKEVALRTGFADQSHLNRGFRQRYRTTPGAYRRALHTARD